MNSHYQIKDEVCLLIQSRRPKQYKKLFNQIVYHKQYPVITVWKDLVIEGIEEFEICEQNDIVYRINRIDLPSLMHVYSWICVRQIERKDITVTMRRFLIGYQALVETSIECGLNHIDELAKGSVLSKLSVIYSYNRQRISCYKGMASSMIKINQKNPSLAKQILDEHLILSFNAIDHLSLRNKEELDHLNSLVEKEDQEERISYNDLLQDLGWERAKRIRRRSLSNTHMEIKKMPEYDPDLPLLSLSLTISSWIDSIQRISSEDLSAASHATKFNLNEKLDQLIFSARQLKENLEEIQHG